MSNLGPYQEFVTAAKTFGGVDDYIKLFEENAVARATPRIVVHSAVATIAAIAGVTAVAVKVMRFKNARAVLALDTEKAHRTLVEGHKRSCHLDEAEGSADRLTPPCPICHGELPSTTAVDYECAACKAVGSGGWEPKQDRPRLRLDQVGDERESSPDAGGTE